MNPALRLFILSTVVRVLSWVAGGLIAKGWFTKDQIGIIFDPAVEWVVGLILAGLTLLYGWARVYIDRRKQLKAQVLPFAVSEKGLDNRIKAGGAPSIWTARDELPGPSTSPRDSL